VEGWAAQKNNAAEADPEAAGNTAPFIAPQLKASGGIRDLKTAKEMIAAGAGRLGTSATIAIMKEYYEAGIDQ
jgi:deoxyribose-phosphate aldolase